MTKRSLPGRSRDNLKKGNVTDGGVVGALVRNTDRIGWIVGRVEWVGMTGRKSYLEHR